MPPEIDHLLYSDGNDDDNDDDYEPPANSVEELLFREFIVLKLGLSRDQKIPFMLRYSTESGRGMIATRNIKKGEIIIEESPAVWGPKAASSCGCCLECGHHLYQLSAVTFCSLCHLHFCSPECANSSYHGQECAEMQKFDIKTDSIECLGKLTLVIVVLRCLLLPETAPQNWARIRLLQDHMNNKSDSKLHHMNQEFIVNFLREIGLERKMVSDTEIHRVCGILESNSFEIKSAHELESRAIFPLCSMANSSCLPNMTHVPRTDRKMVMTATRDIQKGQELFICYTGIRWGRIARRKHLLLTKCFLCCCPRCLDPTECETFISAIKCPECEGNMIQETQILSSELDADWHCDKCKHHMPHKKVVAVEAMIGQMLRLINKNSTQHLEGAARKFNRLLTSGHYILQEIYMSLVTQYEKKNEKHERIVELCDILLPVLEKLEGASRAVAFLMIAKIRAQVSMYKDGKEQLFKSDWLKESVLKFDEAYSLIKHDVQAPVGINQLKITLKKLKEQEDANKDI